MLKARQIIGILTIDSNDDDDVTNDTTSSYHTRDPSPITHRVQVRQSPYVDTFHHHHKSRITIDSGATGNMISLSAVRRLGADIRKSSQSARQADGSSPLTVVGETSLIFVRDKQKLLFEGLVVENLDVEILAGTPFMEYNDITIRPAKRQVILRDNTTYEYGSVSMPYPVTHHSVRLAHVIRAPATPTTVWPGEFVEIDIPDDTPSDSDYAVEPREQSKAPFAWPTYDILPSVGGKIRIPNLTSEPLTLKRNEHFCQIRPVYVPETDTAFQAKSTTHTRQSKEAAMHSTNVRLDPNNTLTADMKTKFRSLLNEYDSVFKPQFSGYNGTSGPFEAKVNMGPVQPPQRKGRLPQYSRDKLLELQDKFDELESKGVFKRPEEVDIAVEYLNPSFLVKKSSGGFRLVTAFADVGRYSKPQPSLMPDVDSTLRQIAQWKHIITTDLTSAFYQIPLSRDSMKYCGVSTPFRGVRVYVRSAMGMPGSETALEELMCRVLGDLLKEGVVAKIADDVYVGGNTPEELLRNFRRFLHALHINGLGLSAPKTVIAPTSTTILGWIWSLGTLQASPHRVITLSTCSTPVNVKDMRSFIGAYKVLARVIPNCSSHLSALDEAIAGGQSKDKIVWSDELHQAFKAAQTALASNKIITLPRSDDQLWIVTDGAVRNPGLGATLYITRSQKPHVSGFFSAKLRNKQPTWLPCEIEALSIAAAIKHFSPYIIQSIHNTCILTDSKPCVQAFEKLCRGEFSASPRVSTFLSVASRYQVSIRHVSGSTILQSDFASRNAAKCEDSACQICSFIHTTQESVTRQVSMQDIMTGKSRLPFTSRAAWLEIQSECPDLRRTHAHLKQGTRPSKKVTNAKDVKRYLNAVTIAKDGLLVVPQNEPLAPSRERIVVPRQVLHGFLTALHIQLNHPSSFQLKQVASRHIFALNLDKAIDLTSESCHTCVSLRKTPHVLVEQTTTDPPDAIGVALASDIIKRNKQLILVLRECVTSFTMSKLIEDERHGTIRDALIELCVEINPLDGPHAVIRTDPAPAFKALINDKTLTQHRLSIEIGRTKNVNKNPVADKAIQELELELLKLDPLGGVVSSKSLAVATASLNTRIRSRGLSAREMWTQRDQFSNNQIQLSDQQLILKQTESRTANHPHSERSKAPMGKTHTSQQLDIGDLVYLHNDGNKSAARNRYLVTSIEDNWCNVRKLVGSQLRSASYRVMKSECYKVPHSIDNTRRNYKYMHESIDDSDDEAELSPTCPAPLPSIPQEISVPPEILSPLEVDLDSGAHPPVLNSSPDEIDSSPDVSVPPSGEIDSSPDVSVPPSDELNSESADNDSIARAPARRSRRLRRQTQFYGPYLSDY
jgi:hypothetical protein